VVRFKRKYGQARPELRCVYWSHGRDDADIQDTVYDEIFPHFFTPGAVNVLGIEDAGTFLDHQRDYVFEGLLMKPTQYIHRHQAG
jgi:hypothetical protein